MSENLKIGTTITEPQERDAIHIAVVPVKAGERLAPGQHVALAGGEELVAIANGKRIGVVDPFLSGPVYGGERFWLFLFPGSITSLRHGWTHPDIPDGEQQGDRAAAEAYLRMFAGRWNMDFDEMVSNASSGDGITARDVDIHSWGEVDDGGREFWRCLETYTGRKFSAEHREDTYFSCSC